MFFVLTKGMSLIGPRPERPAFCEEFEKRIHGWHYRTMVTPGLSGLAQVTGGYDLLPKKKVVLDLWGVHHDIARRLARRTCLFVYNPSNFVLASGHDVLRGVADCAVPFR